MKRSGSKLRNREERGGNIVSIEAYDNTTKAYRKEVPKRGKRGSVFT